MAIRLESIADILRMDDEDSGIQSRTQPTAQRAPWSPLERTAAELERGVSKASPHNPTGSGVVLSNKLPSSASAGRGLLALTFDASSGRNDVGMAMDSLRNIRGAAQPKAVGPVSTSPTRLTTLQQGLLSPSPEKTEEDEDDPISRLLHGGPGRRSSPRPGHVFVVDSSDRSPHARSGASPVSGQGGYTHLTAPVGRAPPVDDPDQPLAKPSFGQSAQGTARPRLSPARGQASGGAEYQGQYLDQDGEDGDNDEGFNEGDMLLALLKQVRGETGLGSSGPADKPSPPWKARAGHGQTSVASTSAAAVSEYKPATSPTGVSWTVAMQPYEVTGSGASAVASAGPRLPGQLRSPIDGTRPGAADAEGLGADAELQSSGHGVTIPNDSRAVSDVLASLTLGRPSPSTTRRRPPPTTPAQDLAEAIAGMSIGQALEGTRAMSAPVAASPTEPISTVTATAHVVRPAREVRFSGVGQAFGGDGGTVTVAIGPADGAVGRSSSVGRPRRSAPTRPAVFSGEQDDGQGHALLMQLSDLEGPPGQGGSSAGQARGRSAAPGADPLSVAQHLHGRLTPSPKRTGSNRAGSIGRSGSASRGAAPQAPSFAPLPGSPGLSEFGATRLGETRVGPSLGHESSYGYASHASQAASAATGAVPYGTESFLALHTAVAPAAAPAAAPGSPGYVPASSRATVPAHLKPGLAALDSSRLGGGSGTAVRELVRSGLIKDPATAVVGQEAGHAGAVAAQEHSPQAVLARVGRAIERSGSLPRGTQQQDSTAEARSTSRSHSSGRSDAGSRRLSTGQPLPAPSTVGPTGHWHSTDADQGLASATPRTPGPDRANRLLPTSPEPGTTLGPNTLASGTAAQLPPASSTYDLIYCPERDAHGLDSGDEGSEDGLANAHGANRLVGSSLRKGAAMVGFERTAVPATPGLAASAAGPATGVSKGGLNSASEPAAYTPARVRALWSGQALPLPASAPFEEHSLLPDPAQQAIVYGWHPLGQGPGARPPFPHLDLATAAGFAGRAGLAAWTEQLSLQTAAVRADLRAVQASVSTAVAEADPTTMFEQAQDLSTGDLARQSQLAEDGAQEAAEDGPALVRTDEVLTALRSRQEDAAATARARIARQKGQLDTRRRALVLVLPALQARVRARQSVLVELQDGLAAHTAALEGCRAVADKLQDQQAALAREEAVVQAGEEHVASSSWSDRLAAAIALAQDQARADVAARYSNLIRQAEEDAEAQIEAAHAAAHSRALEAATTLESSQGSEFDASMALLRSRYATAHAQAQALQGRIEAIGADLQGSEELSSLKAKCRRLWATLPVDALAQALGCSEEDCARLRRERASEGEGGPPGTRTKARPNPLVSLGLFGGSGGEAGAGRKDEAGKAGLNKTSAGPTRTSPQGTKGRGASSSSASSPPSTAATAGRTVSATPGRVRTLAPPHAPDQPIFVRMPAAGASTVVEATAGGGHTPPGSPPQGQQGGNAAGRSSPSLSRAHSIGHGSTAGQPSPHDVAKTRHSSSLVHQALVEASRSATEEGREGSAAGSGGADGHGAEHKAESLHNRAHAALVPALDGPRVLRDRLLSTYSPSIRVRTALVSWLGRAIRACSYRPGPVGDATTTMLAVAAKVGTRQVSLLRRGRPVPPALSLSAVVRQLRQEQEAAARRARAAAGHCHGAEAQGTVPVASLLSSLARSRSTSPLPGAGRYAGEEESAPASSAPSHGAPGGTSGPGPSVKSLFPTLAALAAAHPGLEELLQEAEDDTASASVGGSGASGYGHSTAGQALELTDSEFADAQRLSSALARVAASVGLRATLPGLAHAHAGQVGLHGPLSMPGSLRGGEGSACTRASLLDGSSGHGYGSGAGMRAYGRTSLDGLQGFQEQPMQSENAGFVF